MTTDVEVKVDNLVYKVNKDTAHAIALLLGECGEVVEEIPVEKMWEVVEYKVPNGPVWIKKENDKFSIIGDNGTISEEGLKKHPIQAIKTKDKEGVVYRIGDKIVWDWELSVRDYFTITAISSTRISLGEACATQDIKILIKSGLRHYTEPVKPLVLLTTTDGVDLYKKDARTTLLYAYNTSSGAIGEIYPTSIQFPIADTWKHFVSEENRQNWIEYNKPCLSQKEVNMLLLEVKTKCWKDEQPVTIDEYTEELKCVLDTYVMDKLSKL